MMIGFLKTWANQIIVALIIASIFEMILPNGNNKKYIKMIIGIYVLFTIIQPIVNQITGSNFELSNINYKKYFDTDAIESSSQDFEKNNSKLIEQAYIDNIKNDIQKKIESKEYEVIKCNINIESNEKSENYGTLKSIQIGVRKSNNKRNIGNNAIKIEEVKVSINSNSDTNINEKTNISEKEKTKLIEYLSSEYSISKENIVIN